MRSPRIEWPGYRGERTTVHRAVAALLDCRAESCDAPQRVRSRSDKMDTFRRLLPVVWTTVQVASAQAKPRTTIAAISKWARSVAFLTDCNGRVERRLRCCTGRQAISARTRALASRLDVPARPLATQRSLRWGVVFQCFNPGDSVPKTLAKTIDVVCIEAHGAVARVQDTTSNCQASSSANEVIPRTMDTRPSARLQPGADGWRGRTRFGSSLRSNRWRACRQDATSPGSAAISFDLNYAARRSIAPNCPTSNASPVI